MGRKRLENKVKLTTVIDKDLLRRLRIQAINEGFFHLNYTLTKAVEEYLERNEKNDII